jgi:hypothetical protein
MGARFAVCLMIALAAAGCTFDPAGAPVGDDGPGAPDATAGDDDPIDAARPIDAAPSTPIDAAPTPIDAPALTAPGGACTCDADCADDGGHEGVCIYGVCMSRASSTCSLGGSTDECPAGSRCWGVSGTNAGSICWPDCDAHACVGTCDLDDSCVPDVDNDCNGTCSTVCGP